LPNVARYYPNEEKGDIAKSEWGETNG